MCNQLTKTYEITLEVPVRVTCRVHTQTIEDAMAEAMVQIGDEGIECYYMDYSVMDQAKTVRVEEI
jgi:hypothetical protein